MKRSIVTAILILLFFVWPCQAVIEIKSVTVDGGSNDFGIATFNVTVPADGNFLLHCSNQFQGTGDVHTVDTSTFNGDALTPLVSVTSGDGDYNLAMLYLLAPDVGTFSMVVTPDSDPYYIHIVFVLGGVAQEAPTNTDTDSVTASTSALAIPSAVGQLAIACSFVTSTPVSITEGAGETEQANTDHDNFLAFATSMLGASPTVAPDITLDDTYFASMVGVSLAPLAAAARRKFVGVKE
jgi:hypothetical protein